MILEEVTDPEANFASVHGLMPVTVHMRFSLSWGKYERQVTDSPIAQHQITHLAVVLH